jgi:hypothetical protein
MNQSDVLYNHVFKEFISLGFSDRDSGEVAALAVRLWRRNTPHKEAIKRALSDGKKRFKKSGSA